VDYGDRLGEKGAGKLRIGFQNINDIKGPINAANEIFEVIEDKDVDIMGLAETNINWTETKRQEAKVAIKIRYGQGSITTSSGRAIKDGYLPGGTATIARGKTTGRIIAQGSDEMGRFTWIQLKGKK